MQNSAVSTASIPEEESSQSLQSYFHPDVSPDDLEPVFRLRKAQPLLQAFTALFHGNSEGVLVRLLVLRELVADTTTSAYSRADINMRLAYLQPESLETVLARLRSHHLLSWDAAQSVYRVTPLARNVLTAIDSLLQLGQEDDGAEMGFALSQIAGAQAVGGVSTEQLQHLLGRLVELTEEFRDAIASGSEFRLRAAQRKWHTACDWVEKGSQIIQSITADPRADASTHRAAQAIGRAQSMLLNMQGMFSRALNQIERQRVHLGQSGLSTTDIKTWLMQHADLSSLADDAIEQPLTPMFITPAEMIDVAETELLEDVSSSVSTELPAGQDAPVSQAETTSALQELESWLHGLSSLLDVPEKASTPVENVLLPANFALASYRASLLPLLGDPNESALQGATGELARLPLAFLAEDQMVKLDDSAVAAMSIATLAPAEADTAAVKPEAEPGTETLDEEPRKIA
jgi:hypothetical protein